MAARGISRLSLLYVHPPCPCTWLHPTAEPSQAAAERDRHWSSPTSDTRPLQWGWIDFAPSPDALSKGS